MEIKILGHLIEYDNNDCQELNNQDIALIEEKIKKWEKEWYFEQKNDFGQTTKTTWCIVDNKGELKENITKEDLSNMIYNIMEEDYILDITNNKKIIIETYQDDEDWTFETPNDWIKLIRKIDNEWIEFWFKENAKYYGFSKMKETSDYDVFDFTFEKPIRACVAKIGDKFIVEEIKSIRAEIGYEWFSVRNWRQNEVVNGIDISLYVKEILS